MKIITTLFAVAACHAGTISTLYNTGTGGPVDPHWTVNGASAYVTDASGFPFGSHWPPNGDATWISPQPSYTSGQTDAPGQYLYSTQFDLSGYDPSTASLLAQFAADDSVLLIYLNGNLSNFFLPVTGFITQSAAIQSGFVFGINELDFLVVNMDLQSANPTGLRVSFASNADPAGPPPPPQAPEVTEPGTVALIGAGLVVMAWRGKRRA